MSAPSENPAAVLMDRAMANTTQLDRQITLAGTVEPRAIAGLLTKAQRRTVLAMPDRRPKSLRMAHKDAKCGFVWLPFRLCHPRAGREMLTPLGLAVKCALLPGHAAEALDSIVVAFPGVGV